MTPSKKDTTKQQSEEPFERVANYAEEAASRVGEITDRVESGVRRAGRELRSEIEKMDLDEATVPDAFRKVPKLISPRVHSWLDFATTAYFMGIGIWFAVRGKGRAAAAAFVNGGMVAGVSMMTDYDGDGEKPLSFKMHGTMDAAQATTAALSPVVYGFADRPEAKYFWSQAANELAVVSTTDWDAGMPAAKRREAA